MKTTARKLLAILFILVMLLCITACGGGNENENKNKNTLSIASIDRPAIYVPSEEEKELINSSNQLGTQSNSSSSTVSDKTTTSGSNTTSINSEASVQSQQSGTNNSNSASSNSSVYSKPNNSNSTSSNSSVYSKPNSSSDTSSTSSGGTQVKTKDASCVYYADAGYHLLCSSSNDYICGLYDNYVYTTASEEEILIYAGGYFISEQNNIQYLKKYDGTVICSTKSLNITGFGMTDNYTDYLKFLRDGYVFAYKTIESYSGVKYEVGVLGVNGKWIAPLSASNPIITSGMTCNEENFQKQMRYLDEGMLLLTVKISDYDFEYVFYNINDNKVYRLTGLDYSWNMDYIISESEFENGVSYFRYWGTMYKITNKGVMSASSVCYDNLSTGYGEYVDKNGNIYSLHSNGRNAELCKNGKLVKEFDDIEVTNAVLVDDRWLAIIENSEGSYYYTFIKTDGTFAFEPIKTTATYVCTESGFGAGTTDDISQGSGLKIVIDKNGKILFEKTTSNYMYVKNGVVYLSPKNSFSSAKSEFHFIY